MDNTIAVQVLNCDSNLIRQFFDSLFPKLEIPKLDIVEEIFSLHVLKHDVVIV